MSIPVELFEREVAGLVERLLELLRTLHVATPIYVAVSLLGVEGCVLKVSDLSWRSAPGRAIDRPDLLIPEISLERYEDLDVFRFLRPIFDMVWNAAGKPGSQSYNSEGEWGAR